MLTKLTLSLYNITDPGAALPAPFATMTADLDQSQFDTIAIGSQQIFIGVKSCCCRLSCVTRCGGVCF
jgi:hypothetical protein